MYNKPMLSLDQTQDAIKAMIDEYNKDPNRRKVDIAIVDDAGKPAGLRSHGPLLEADLRHPKSLHLSRPGNGHSGLC